MIVYILTTHEDDGGNYHSQGGVHTGPSITPEAKPRGDRRAGRYEHRGSDNFLHHPITEQSIFVLYTLSFSLIPE